MRLFHALLSAALVSLMAAVVPAFAGGPAPGSIIITERMLNPKLYTYQSDLKTEARSSLTKNPDTEAWKVHFIAYLKKSSGSPDVNIVFYDQTPPKPGQPREPVQAYPIKTTKDASILISEVSLKEEEGFKIGGKYQVLITRLINGKEEVYARTSLELK